MCVSFSGGSKGLYFSAFHCNYTAFLVIGRQCSNKIIYTHTHTHTFRSAHSNAYFYGFGSNKCIVLFDTLLEDDLKPKKEEEKPLKPETEDDTAKEGEDSTGSDKSQEDMDDKQASVDGTQESKETATDKDSDQSKVTTKGCNMEEILAVLAHELGHWKFSHNLKKHSDN